MSLTSHYHDRRYVKNLDKLSAATYKWKDLRDVRIKLKDGCEICVDLFIPESPKPLPTLFSVSPYGKDTQAMGAAQQPPESITFDHMIEGGDVPYFASRGYNFVVMDLRGTGKSGGAWSGFYNEIDQDDCVQIIEWIAKQSWSDGQVAMAGHSYFGVMQLLLAGKKPAALKTITPIESFLDFYDRAWPGGMPSTWYWFLLHNCTVHTSILTTEQELGPEKFAEHLKTLRNWKDIKQNSFFVREFNAPAKDAPYFDLLMHPSRGEFWEKRSPVTNLDKVDIPIYSGGFWGYYTYIDGVFDTTFPKDKRSNRIGRVLSYGTGGTTKLPLKLYNEDLLRWYDHWLKGVDTGLLEEPPLKIFIMGAERFRYENEWPLKRTAWTKLHLRRFGELSTVPETDGEQAPDILVHSPPSVTADYNPLVYKSAPLQHPTEISGPIALKLHVSIDTDDANFIIQLYDVAPNGRRTFLTKGYLRASHRALDEKNSKPWRPVRSRKSPQPVPAGEVQEYEIALSPISNLFKPGHRIELDICTVDAAILGKDTSFGFGPAVEDKMPAMNTLPGQSQTVYRIFRDQLKASHLLVPIIPLETTEDNQWVQPLAGCGITI